MKILYLGIQSYAETLILMEKLHLERTESIEKDGIILVVSHPPTVTMGKRELFQDLLFSQDDLKTKKVDFFKVDRGGSVTVHEPGQVVIYPIFHIQKYQHTVRSYIYLLEETMIQIAAKYLVHATRDTQYPGVWVGKDKIGAIGIRISKKVTKHGIAFNVENSLNTFQYIVPCGIVNRGVISLKEASKKQKEKNIEPPEVLFSVVEKEIAELLLKNLISHDFLNL